MSGRVRERIHKQIIAPSSNTVKTPQCKHCLGNLMYLLIVRWRVTLQRACKTLGSSPQTLTYVQMKCMETCGNETLCL